MCIISCCLAHALRFIRKSYCAQEKVPPRIYTSMHSGGLELAKLTYSRLEDNLTHHRGDRQHKHTLLRELVARYDAGCCFMFAVMKTHLDATTI